MKTPLRLFAVLLLAVLPAAAVDLITATVTLTNLPTTNAQTLTINASTRSWTNDANAAPGTLVQTTNTIAKAATNLLNHLSRYPAATWHFLSQTTPTNITIRGMVGESLTVTVAGGWAGVTYATQTVASPTLVVRVPVSVETVANQTNIGSGLVEAINLASNKLATNAVALQNYLTVGPSPTQTVTAPVVVNAIARATNAGTIYGGTYQSPTLTGAVIHAVSGNLSNVTGVNITITNLSSPGAGAASEVLGASAAAIGANATAIGAGASSTNIAATSMGYGALAEGVNGTAIGTIAEANGYSSTSLGQAAKALGESSTAIGDNAYASGLKSAAFGRAATVTHENSTAVGYNATSTDSNQIVLGTSSQHVLVPGRIESPTLTNGTAKGTTFVNGLLRSSIQTVASLANSNNVFPSVTAPLVEITVGALTLPFNVCSIPAGASGQLLTLVNLTGQDMWIEHESGVDATAANRIISLTGATRLTTGNGAAHLYYSASQTRWILYALDP